MVIIELECKMKTTKVKSLRVNNNSQSEITKPENTERKSTLEQIPTMEEHLLDFLLDTIPDNVYFKDIESRFIKTSKTQAEALGVSDPAQLVGKSDFDFYPEE